MVPLKEQFYTTKEPRLLIPSMERAVVPLTWADEFVLELVIVRVQLCAAPMKIEDRSRTPGYVTAE